VASDGDSERIPTASAAHSSGADQATRHLLDLGHRRIAAITGPRAWIATEERQRGYRAEVATILAPVGPTAFDGAMKVGVIAAAALLFVVVLRRMTAPALAPSYGPPASDILAVGGANAGP